MSIIYRRHECTTLEEVNALALTDGEENGCYVISPWGDLCRWVPEYQYHGTTRGGEWSYDDSMGGGSVYFPLDEGDVVTVLVPIALEDLIRDTVTEALAEQARQAAEADKKRREFDNEVRRRLQEQYLPRPYPATQFNRLGE